MDLDTEEWVVEYWGFTGLVDHIENKLRWRRAYHYLEPGVRYETPAEEITDAALWECNNSTKRLPPLPFASAVEIAASRQNGSENLHYRIRNLRTGDVLPAAIL